MGRTEGTVRAMSKPSVLVIDDDPVTVTTFRGLLEPQGYAVTAVECGETARACIRARQDWDVILLDVVLPDMNGIDLCREIKGRLETEDISIILVSAFRKDDASIRSGLEAGADGYLVKPIEDIALKAWVRASLRIRSLRRELSARRPSSHTTLEDTLRQFARLSHAVNNPLQALYASADVLSLTVPQSEQTQKLIVEILHHAERVAQMVAQASYQVKSYLGADSERTPDSGR